MPDLVGALELGLGLEEAAGVLEQDLGILGLDGGVLVLVLEVLQVPPQLLVLDVLGVDLLAAAVGLVRLLQAPPPRLFLGRDEFHARLLDGQGAVVAHLGHGLVNRVDLHGGLWCGVVCVPVGSGWTDGQMFNQWLDGRCNKISTAQGLFGGIAARPLAAAHPGTRRRYR